MKKALSICIALLMLCACARAPVGDTDMLDWQTQYDLGLRYLSEGNYEEAILAFTAAIEIDPKQAPAYVGRGDAYVGAAELLAQDTLDEQAAEYYDCAETDYCAALELDQLIAHVYSKLADVYLVLGNMDAAIGILERGYERTGDESLLDRLNELILAQEQGLMVPSGSTTVTMYNPDEGLVGYDVYTFDARGRMLRNAWIDSDGVTVIVSETWEYDDVNNQTISTRLESKWTDEGEETGAMETTVETLDGCEDMGWYWLDMSSELGTYLTDPTLAAVDGRVALEGDEWENSSWAVYQYAATGRVSAIHTYTANGTLIGYCTVIYKE